MSRGVMDSYTRDALMGLLDSMSGAATCACVLWDAVDLFAYSLGARFMPVVLWLVRLMVGGRANVR